MMLFMYTLIDQLATDSLSLAEYCWLIVMTPELLYSGCKKRFLIDYKMC